MPIEIAYTGQVKDGVWHPDSSSLNPIVIPEEVPSDILKRAEEGELEVLFAFHAGQLLFQRPSEESESKQKGDG
jgi:hypothetical protein